MGKYGDFVLKNDKKSTIFTLEAFWFYRNQDKNSLKILADYLYYGIKNTQEDVERYSNSFKLYKSDWNYNKDYYSLYSMALMEEKGEGVESNPVHAKEKLKSLVKAGIYGETSPVSILSGAVGLGKIYIKELIQKFSGVN